MNHIETVFPGESCLKRTAKAHHRLLTGKCRRVLRVATFNIFILIIGSALVSAQHDPGPRAGSAGAGGTIDAAQLTNFITFQSQFAETQVVLTNNPNGNGGLGPRFNGNGCAMCHSQPAIGGSSPGLSSPQVPQVNPQIAVATLAGAQNVIPSFITPEGPVRESRYVDSTGVDGAGNTIPIGRPDGSVHDLFVIAGRSDASGCKISQPDFAQEMASGNVIFRIPTPLFGLGLVDNVPDSALIANLASTATRRQALGIGGHFNSSGNTGTITRFGWKAQTTLNLFVGEAYNVEMGVTNDLFPNERGADPTCLYNPLPEDSDLYALSTGANPPISDVAQFLGFIRLLAPPAASTASPSELAGATLFDQVGCTLCHSPTLTTGASAVSPALNYASFHPFSDFALHGMGKGLADGISQGSAEGDEFRTAPLWGVGQRLFFLHDGRTADLLQAIEAHSGPRSEANRVIDGFNKLSSEQQQQILNFLRSL